ncbi:hypothetical protein AALP_AA4G081800 [Arabis alpina]|uniref:Uncharacterized protein n=1 Tax=Arabis alpina TaxID=50452 RepID=A0A087H1Y1_ARAAL|nr:hypothetical protein AALP_AA4G081800 [Arabis alpina]
MSFLLRSLGFFFLIFCFLNTFGSPTQHDLCNPDQRDALLEFKTEFAIQKSDSWIFSYPKSESWVNNSDCCSWNGVTCDAKSGKVIGLDLTASCLHGWLKSNSSLFKLRHLRDLNLAYNYFAGSPIPAEFDNLMGLKRLNLSQSSLSGPIPTKLLQLTKLVSLDLSSSSSLSIDESFLPLLAQNLRNLRELDMSSVNISSKIPHELSNMWSLRSLGLEECNLFGEFPSSVLLMPNLESINLDNNPDLRGNLPSFPGNSSLQRLNISFTSFSGSIPDSISNLKHLTSLKLSKSNFSGKIPYSLGRTIPFSLGNLSHLSYLDLTNNNLIGEIPSSIGNLKQLSVFYVGHNKVSGNFPSSLLNLTQLRSIHLDSNNLTGFLPPNISQLYNLKSLWASYNSFTGAIPSSLFKISSLTDIDLDHNQLSLLDGIENISLLPNLHQLYIGNNNYNVSPLDFNVFSPLKQLEDLDLSGIPLSTANTTSDFHLNLEVLYLPGCSITSFPEFIRNQRVLQTLDLSNNKIKGQVPEWLWKLPNLLYVDLSNNSLTGFKGSLEASLGSQIYFVDLSSNAFQGPIFVPSSSIGTYFASKNNFTGEIPRSICGLSDLSLLDLSNNNLHGSIPRCLETQMIYLSDLNLRNNSLTGSLPHIFTNAKSLRSLDVSHNRLVGNLSTSLRGCSSLEVLNVGNNQINDTFPFWLNSLQMLQVLVLRCNKFHGVLHHPQVVVIGFPSLRIIDVLHNDFTGTLRSDYFTNLKAMYTNGDDTEFEYMGRRGGSYYDSLVLMSKGVEMEMTRILTIYTAVDFSGNKIKGSIPESVSLLKGLRVLNLSSNGFTGNIPSSLENLTNLESLDLSQNKISGEIPPELGDVSSLAWINVSHNQLVGSIPQGTQFQRQNCSSYEGNPGLYGPSLKDICGDNSAPASKQPKPVEPEEEEEEEWLSWVAAGLGFAPGVVFGLTIGYIAVTYKHEWFTKTFGRNKRRSTRTR